MSDQQAEPTEAPEATPETGTPTTTEELFEQRYNNLRPQYDRVQNELRKYEDPEYRANLLKELAEEQGYSFSDDTPDEYLDPTEQLRAELRAELQQEFSKRDQAAKHEQAALYAEAHSESTLDRLQVEDEKVRDWIVSRATAMPALQDDHGFIVPDVEAAYAEWQEIVTGEKKRWGDKKAGVQVAASEGHEHTGVPSWRNEQDPDKRRELRNAWALEQIEMRKQAG